MHRVPIDELKHREYWTPQEAARVLGRGRDFWAAAFDDPDTVVTGYTENTNRRGPTRYLLAETCRAHLESLRADKGGWDPDAFAALCAADPRFQAAQREGQLKTGD